MKLDKILLIDFTKDGTYSGNSFYRNYGDFNGHLDVIYNNDQLSKINIARENYIYLLLHDMGYERYKSDHFDSIIESFPSKHIVKFSAAAEANRRRMMTERNTLFSELRSCINAYLKVGVFPDIKLFRPNESAFYPIIDPLTEMVEDEDDTLSEARELQILFDHIVDERFYKNEFLSWSTQKKLDFLKRVEERTK